MDQSQTDNAVTEANEEEIVVDALEVERDIKPYDKDFILPGGQIIGLDQAVIKSIERCRKHLLKDQITFDNISVYYFFFNS